MKNKQVKQMMVGVEDFKQGMGGFKTVNKMGWHGFDDRGLFHCSGSNFMWLYEDVTVSLTANQLKSN